MPSPSALETASFAAKRVARKRSPRCSERPRRWRYLLDLARAQQHGGMNRSPKRPISAAVCSPMSISVGTDAVDHGRAPCEADLREVHADGGGPGRTRARRRSARARSRLRRLPGTWVEEVAQVLQVQIVSGVDAQPGAAGCVRGSRIAFAASGALASVSQMDLRIRLGIQLDAIRTQCRRMRHRLGIGVHEQAHPRGRASRACRTGWRQAVGMSAGRFQP